MKRWHMVIIGAGPAGSYAAKVAAGNGLQVLLLEEHPVIGQPRHCPGWLLGTEFTEELLKSLENPLKLQKVHGFEFYDPQSSELILNIPDTGWGGYLVERQAFDRELALMALKSGAQISINTKVTGLLREKDQVVGVETDHKHLSRVMAEVVVCADGIHSLSSGLGKSELLKDKEEKYKPALLLELNGVRDIRPGIIESYVSNDPVLAGRTLWTHSKDICLMTIANINLFDEIKKRDDNLLSRKIKDAQIIQMAGCRARADAGRFCERVVDKGILFVGDASGCHGIIHGMISAHYGAMAAVKAIQKRDLDMIEDYDQTLKASDIYKHPYLWPAIKENYQTFAEVMDGFKGIKL